MQTTTLSCFRFDTRAAKLWAFSRMQFARGPLQRTPGVSFCQLMGSGSGESFSLRPNFGVYAVLLVWPDEDTAREGLVASPVMRAYRDHACEEFTVHLGTLSASGRWSGVEPFAKSETKDGRPASSVRPLGVLTRATLRTPSLVQFWQTVPGVSADIAGHPDVLFKLGMGELPFFHQVTFSIWKDATSMRTFAYRNKAHSEAVRLAHEKKWFKEDLFARFRILRAEGTWYGRAPLAESETIAA